MFDHFLLHIFSEDRLQSLALAMMLAAIPGFLFGPLGGNANPFLWTLLDTCFGKLASRTYNIERSVASLRFRGAFLLTLYLLTTGLIAALGLLAERRFALAGFMDPVLLALALSGGSVWSSLIKLQSALKGKNAPTKGGYYRIARTTRTNLNSTDNHGIIRTGIGLVGTSFDKALIAPAFWYLIGGLPAAYIYSGIAAARWGLGKEGFAKGMGTLAITLEKVTGIVPQLLSGFFLTLAAATTPSASVWRSIIGMVGGKNRAPYTEGGLPVTILAYALNLSLGGPVEDLGGSVIKRAWTGPSGSSARAENKHLRLAIYMGIMAFAWAFLFAVGGIVLHRIA